MRISQSHNDGSTMKGSRRGVSFLFVFFGVLCGFQMALIKELNGLCSSGHGDYGIPPTPTDVDPVVSVDNNGNSGWHQIDVFYGQREGMLVTLPDNSWLSQVGQDKMVHRLLGDMKGGFFVDLASNDATVISNLYSLETFHDWDGLCFEANAKYWARLAFCKCRVISAVVGHNRMEEIDFDFGPKAESMVSYHHGGRKNDGGMGGGIVGKDMDNKNNNKKNNNIVKRYTVPLQEIFERNSVPKIIDYFSLDVEGAESYIMSAFPFDRYMFRVISIERPKDSLKALLKTHNYTFFKTVSGWGETIWIHGSESERIKALP